MSNDVPESFSLKRWSQRKHAAAAGAAAMPAPAPAESAPVAVVAPPGVAPPVARADPSVAPADPSSAPSPARVESMPPAALPTIESLTFDSDYTAFMRPDVAAGTKSAALRKLFSDPRFNVMDGLDTYIGDYSQADPMPPGMLEKLADVYKTVVDVPPVGDELHALDAAIPVDESAPALTEECAPIAVECAEAVSVPAGNADAEASIQSMTSPFAPDTTARSNAS